MYSLSLLLVIYLNDRSENQKEKSCKKNGDVESGLFRILS